MNNEYYANGVRLRVTDGEPGKKIFSIDFEYDINEAEIAESLLPPSFQTCRICYASGEFETFLFTERFDGTRERFRYFRCTECGCVQIEEIPENLGKYYASSYYSYAKATVLPRKPGVPRNDRRILDVGCGSGHWLLNQYHEGATQLFGCDPFIENDIRYPNGVIIFKRSIEDMPEGFTGQLDYIRFGQSFEHVTNPCEVIAAAERLLAPGGTIDLELPVSDCADFDVFGTFLVSVDAPRHLFLHTRKSLEIIAAKNNLKLRNKKTEPLIKPVVYDFSTIGISQLYISGLNFIEAFAVVQHQHQYQHDLPHNQKNKALSLISVIGNCESTPYYELSRG